MALRLMGEKSELTAVNGVTKFVGTVWADTKEEIVPGLAIDGDLLDFGSVAITKNFEVAQLGSDGQWVWKQ